MLKADLSLKKTLMSRHYEEPEQPRIDMPLPPPDWRPTPPDEQRDDTPRGVVIIGPDGSENESEPSSSIDPNTVDYRV